MISWSCRGLGNLSVVPKLKCPVCYYKSDALIFSATLVHFNKIEEFCYLLSFDNCLIVSFNGQSDDLTLLRCNSLNCIVLHYFAYHITLKWKTFVEVTTSL